MKYLKSLKYDYSLIKDNMMGPNSMKILEELLENVPLKRDMRVLDLGCGKGLTSIFLAKEYGVQVFAVDLWISPSENYNRFKELELENQIIPIHSEAISLPFANNYFDAVISIDSYHYFGNNDTFFDKYLAKFLKEDAWVAMAFPGMKHEVLDNVPNEMKPYWPEDALQMWHSIDWWKDILIKAEKLELLDIGEMKGFSEPWKDWLETDNVYAIGDRAMIEADDGRYMNLISVIGKKKQGADIVLTSE